MEQKLNYVITIPSIDIPGHVAINDLILIGRKDKRYRKIKRQNKVLSKYLNSFRTPFNKKVYPSIILRDEKLPKVEAVYLSSFRNAIAVSSVIYSRVKSYLSNSQTGFYCTDLFDFCPVSVSSDGTDLSVKTAHEMGAWAPVDKFRGQVTPSVVHPEIIHPMFDNELMLCALNLIERKDKNTIEKQFKNRVIRSLEMAYYALRSPYINLGRKTTDFGVPICLWVSAFEILAHPNTRDVEHSDVENLIEQVKWKFYKLKWKGYTKISKDFGKKKRINSQKTTLPVQIYRRLTFTRNMYLHGNPIPKDRYEYFWRKNWGNLYFQVPALYRCVLLNLLLKRDVQLPSNLYNEQNMYERALLKKVK